MQRTDMAKMGVRICALRKKRGLTQTQLAETMRISASQLSHIERGIRAPSLDMLVELSRFFDVGLDYLVFGRLPDERAWSGEYLILREGEEYEAREGESV